jgi:hypothetical protein
MISEWGIGPRRRRLVSYGDTVIMGRPDKPGDDEQGGVIAL